MTGTFILLMFNLSLGFTLVYLRKKVMGTHWAKAIPKIELMVLALAWAALSTLYGLFQSFDALEALPQDLSTAAFMPAILHGINATLIMLSLGMGLGCILILGMAITTRTKQNKAV